jgi:ADP-heptose:LPS heptosyltransferase
MKFLVIRRDNIGDLVCTTPLIRALRTRYPAARIDALVNSYNRPIIEYNEDLNHVYAYTKAKHRAPDESVFSVYWRRAVLMFALRRERYDWVILANGGYMKRPLRLAKWVKPRSIVGFVPPGARTPIDCGIPLDDTPGHEVETLFRLLAPFGIDGPPPKLRLSPKPLAQQHAQTLLAQQPWYRPDAATIAIHISARKLRQRWPWDRFAELMQRLHAARRCQFMLLWSPGDESNPHHPGDDRKAEKILTATRDLPVLALPTLHLEQLIGGLSICQAMICSDGGAMHIGAALDLPIICFFGNSDPCVWHPWRVPHEVLRPASHDVNDISVDDAFAACQRLSQGTGFTETCTL